MGKKETCFHSDSGLVEGAGSCCCHVTSSTSALLKASYQMTEDFFLWQVRGEKTNKQKPPYRLLIDCINVVLALICLDKTIKMINVHLVRTRSPWRLWRFRCLLRDKASDGIVRGRQWANSRTSTVILSDNADGAGAHQIWGRLPSDVLRRCWRADQCSGDDSPTLRGDSLQLHQYWMRAQHIKTKDEGCIFYRTHLSLAAYPLLCRGLLLFTGLLWLQRHRRLFHISVDQPCRERETISLTAESRRKEVI